MSQIKQRAVFLDRDGTINKEVNFLSHPGKVQILPGVAEGLRFLKSHGFTLVVISNQSGLARGIFDEADLAAVQLEIKRQLAAQGAAIDGAYFCPHHPSEGVVEELVRECSCRKPAPGLIHMAAQEMALNLENSFMVGDRLRDIACGKAAGLKTVLVTTGRYRDDGLLKDWLVQPDYTAPDFPQAARWIIEKA